MSDSNQPYIGKSAADGRPHEDEEIPLEECGQAVYDFDCYKERRTHLLIRDVKYDQDLIQKDKTFPSGLSFVNVIFEKEVNFNRSVFNGPIYFWNCVFLSKASFFHIRVCADCAPVQMRLSGEANFSYSRFERTEKQGDQPSFDRALFGGTAFFYRTAFCNGVSMEETRFDGGVRFEGSQSSICISSKHLLNTIDVNLLSVLLHKDYRILKTNADHDKDHYDFDSNIRSSNNLMRRLSEIPELRLIIKLFEREQANRSSQSALVKGTRKLIEIYKTYQNSPALTKLSGNLLRLSFVRKALRTIPSDLPLTSEQEALKSSLEKLIRYWEEGFSLTMFNGRISLESIFDQKRASGFPKIFTRRKLTVEEATISMSSFRGAHFGVKSAFSRVDLGRCFFQGTNICEVDFLVARWARRPCGLVLRHVFSDEFRNLPFLPHTNRDALRDEIDLDEYSVKVRTRRELISRRLELSKLYRELRISADREGDAQKSRDFYFGELEAQRLTYPVVWRNIGILVWYKRFSGYSKREVLALSWLVVWIFVLFPLLTCLLINWPEYKIFRDGSFDISESYVKSTACEPPSLSDNPLFPYAVVSQQDIAAANGLINTDKDAVEKVKQTAAENRKRYNRVLSRAADSVWGNGTLKSRYLRLANSSLQASTFFPSSSQTNAIDAATQIIQGVNCLSPDDLSRYSGDVIKVEGLQGWRKGLEELERVIVPAQLGLFFLALRSKFQRTR